MATPGVKFDDGTGGFASKCFPVRGILGNTDSGSGAWLLAHRADQRRRFKAVLCAKPRTYDQIHEERRKSEKDGTNIIPPVMYEEEEEEEEKVLDGFFLMKHCCVEDPSDLCSINISDQGLTEVKEEDFALFDSVAYVNAAENILPLESFNSFPLIRELEMPLNGLRGLKINPGDFQNIEMLDLSYNNLSPDDLLPLGLLPRLRILHATGNGLQNLPVDLAHAFVDEQTGKRLVKFPCLEILMLDDNRLSDVTLFAALAGLRRLMHLDLSKNEIYSVPQLMVVHGRHVTTEFDSSDLKKSKRSESRSRKRGQRPKSRTGLDRRTPTNTPNPLGRSAAGLLSVSPADVCAAEPEKNKRVVNGDEHNLRAAKEIIQEANGMNGQEVDIPAESDKPDGKEGQKPSLDAFNFDEMGELGEINLSDLDTRIEKEVNDEEVEEGKQKQGTTSHGLYNDMGPLPPPFPEVRHINLSHNKVHEEEALLPLAVWPELSELVIHDNPLTKYISGDPPLLKKYLYSKLGIKIVRKKPPLPGKPVIEVQPNPDRKVETKVPKIPKRDIDKELLALEAPLRPALTDKPASPKVKQIEEKSQPNSPGRPLGATKPLPPISTPPEEKQRNGWVSSEDKTDSQKEGPVGEAFFMTQVDEQGEVKKPSKASHQEKVSPGKGKKQKPKPVDSKYKGYEELLVDDGEILDDDIPLPKDLTSNIKALQYALNHPLIFRDNKVQLDKPQKPFYPYKKTTVPRPPPRKTKNQQMEEALSMIKNRTTVEEANLAEVLSNSDQHQQQFPEASALLGKIQHRYNKVRASSIKSARENEAKEMTGLLEEMVQDVRSLKLTDKTNPVLAK